MAEEVEASAEPSEREVLVDQVRHAFGRAAYTQKTQEKQADQCYAKHRRQQWFLIVLTAVSSGAFVTSLTGWFLSTEMGAVVTSFIAVLVSGATLATKNFTYGEDMQKHRDTASRLWDIRESYISLLVDLQSGAASPSDGRSRRDDLQARAYKVYSDAPRTTRDAYQSAQKAIQEEEEMTFSDEEIDLMLPMTLRRTNGGNA